MESRSGMNVLAIGKNSGENYIFYYDDQSGEALKNVVDSFAANPRLSFTKEDAEAIKERIRGIFPQTTT